VLLLKLSIIICGDAGKGKHNPYNALQSDLRKAIIVGLHKGQSIADLARSYALMGNEVLGHLESLQEGGFVKEKNGKLVPSFFVALKRDVTATRKASLGLGRSIGEIYEANWETIVETYNHLPVSSRFGFERVGFVLIGAYSLDMISRFAEEGDIMPRAPKRKSGRYYLWAVENGMDALGRYGMHSGKCRRYRYASFGGERQRRRTSPPDHQWKFMGSEMKEENPMAAYTKFQTLVGSERKSVEEKIKKTTLNALREYERKYHDESHEVSKETENLLRQWRYLDANGVPIAPIYSEEDMGTISEFVDEMAAYIFDEVYKNLNMIKATFSKCDASTYASFPEFFCWYYHLVFTETMDYLIRKQRLSQPKYGYEYWVWKI